MRVRSDGFHQNQKASTHPLLIYTARKTKGRLFAMRVAKNANGFGRHLLRRSPPFHRSTEPRVVPCRPGVIIDYAPYPLLQITPYTLFPHRYYFLSSGFVKSGFSQRSFSNFPDVK